MTKFNLERVSVHNFKGFKIVKVFLPNFKERVSTGEIYEVKPVDYYVQTIDLMEDEEWNRYDSVKEAKDDILEFLKKNKIKKNSKEEWDLVL